jgi:signal transduction histidine kinase
MKLPRLIRPVAEARTWKETAHLLLDLPAGIAWFTAVVTLVSLSIGLLAAFLLGIPIFIATLLFARVISAVDRWRARTFLDLPLASPFKRLGGGGSLWDRAGRIVADSAGWKALTYGVLMLPIGIFSFTVAVTLWSTTLGCLTAGAWGWALPENGIRFGNDVTNSGFLVNTWYEYAVLALLGVVLLVVTLWTIRGLANLVRLFERAMLGPGAHAALTERVTQLDRSRAASVDASEQELRRIERDLHDGAQQRLVALAMDLGMARQRLADGLPADQVAGLVDQAHEEAKQAIAELRDLVRGIHPAVLTDRGLDAALSAVAARSPVPVEVDVELPVRPPPAVETTAYYVAAEALTNVAKHARASRATIRVRQVDDVVVVEVGDDGRGGAQIGDAGGLAGLRDRVLGIEGTLRVASPPGGPTMLVAELPCGS